MEDREQVEALWVLLRSAVTISSRAVPRSRLPAARVALGWGGAAMKKPSEKARRAPPAAGISPPTSRSGRSCKSADDLAAGHRRTPNGRAARQTEEGRNQWTH